MTSRSGVEKQKSSSQVSLGGVMIVIAFLALLLSIVARSTQARSPEIIVFTLAIFAILTVPTLILWLVIRYSPSSRNDERDLMGLVVMTLLFIILVSLSVFVNLF
jgi:hypothetical protein